MFFLSTRIFGPFWFFNIEKFYEVMNNIRGHYKHCILFKFILISSLYGNHFLKVLFKNKFGNKQLVCHRHVLFFFHKVYSTYTPLPTYLVVLDQLECKTPFVKDREITSSLKIAFFEIKTLIFYWFKVYLKTTCQKCVNFNFIKKKLFILYKRFLFPIYDLVNF